MAETAQRIDAISKHLGQTLKYANECEHVYISTVFTCVHVVIQPISSCFVVALLNCSPCVRSYIFAHSFPYIFLLVLFFCNTKDKIKRKQKEKKKN